MYSRALQTELSGARKHHPLSAAMMMRAEWKCLIASTPLARFLALLRLSSVLSDPVPFPVPVPISATALVSVPAPVPFLSCVRPRFSTPVPVFMCVCVCVCGGGVVCIFIKLYITTQATRPCHPSNSMPHALILSRGDQWYLYYENL